MNNVTGVILAGGLGTRLRPLLPNIAKVIAPVAGQPFINLLLRQLAKAAVSRIILCIGYRGNQVAKTVGRYFASIPILYSLEQKPLGTAGALGLAWKTYSENEPWVVMNGDSYLDMDLQAFLIDHIHARAVVTMAITRMPPGHSYGRLFWSEQSRNALSFRPATASDQGSEWINAGIYAMNREFLRSLPHDRPSCLDNDIFPNWVSYGLRVHPASGGFLDIGTPANYSAAEELLKRIEEKDSRLNVPSR